MARQILRYALRRFCHFMLRSEYLQLAHELINPETIEGKPPSEVNHIL